MNWSSFKVQYLEMVAKFGNDKFTKEEQTNVWEVFHDMDEDLAVAVFQHVLRTHKVTWPATPLTLINEGKKAKAKFEAEKKMIEHDRPASWEEMDPEAPKKALQELGVNSLAEYFESIQRKKFP